MKRAERRLHDDEERPMAWEQEYRDHELWTSVATALEALSKLAPEEITNDLARLQAVLNEINGHAQQPHAALTNGHLTAVKNVVDIVGSSLPDSPATIFSPPSNNRNGQTPYAQLTQQIRAWPATGSTSRRGLSKQAKQVEASFASLSTRLDERLAEIEAQANERSEAASASLEQQKTRLDTALSSHQEKFSAAQEERTQKWSSLLEDNDASCRSTSRRCMSTRRSRRRCFHKTRILRREGETLKPNSLTR